MLLESNRYASEITHIRQALTYVVRGSRLENVQSAQVRFAAERSHQNVLAHLEKTPRTPATRTGRRRPPHAGCAYRTWLQVVDTLAIWLALFDDSRPRRRQSGRLHDIPWQGRKHPEADLRLLQPEPW